MNHALTLTMKRPTETLGIPVPLGRRLQEAGRMTWVFLLVSATVAMVAVYVFQVNMAANKGFTLRDLQTRLDRLNDTVAVLESQAAELQTVKAVEERVKDLGYVPVDRMEFMNVPHTAYAMAR